MERANSSVHFENRRADFAEAEGGENFVGGLLDVIPEGGFRWQ